MILYIVGSLIGIALIVLSISAMIAQIKTWRILEEIVNSGTIPKVSEARIKKEANEIIRYGAIQDSKRADKIYRLLSNLRSDQEAISLAQRISDLKKFKG